MKIGKPLLTAGMFALAITLLMIWLPHAAWQRTAAHNNVAVFHAIPAVRLTNSNLVDVLVSVKLNERLNKVEWSSGILSVDMRVSTIKGRPTAMFEDIEKLVRVSFLQLENVKRVLIRFVEMRPDGEVLLAAVDVRKTDEWLISEIGRLSGADPVHDELWRGRLRVSFTTAWEEKFGKATGFSAKPASFSHQ
ncbi:hypothetical protein BK133_10645 [Paenibacillus sp. FSL H8-0548]|uniref:hypothetical protein n=1 Tax=Paenibacillus sp. FSL H8-0548 TaxID=1920422 RepID=UPI00096FFB5D|nr:hypothetical protein [Paenibacillus sp. FSL H8-0548]OMF35165.1 hypothetical protein BK133_10645 [Paenibacillus sp. FSL H8-0548]